MVQLDLRVSSGTYVRAIADALGGHCRTLRRTEIGPFSVDEAGPRPVHSAADAGSAGRRAVTRRDRRARPEELEPTARVAALGSFDGVHLGHRRVLETAFDAGTPADGGHVRPAPSARARQPRRAAFHARAAARAARGRRRRRGARRRVHSGARGARAVGVLATSILAKDRRRGDRGRRELPLRPRRGR